MSSIRERALKESHKHEASRYFVDESPVSSYFGQNVLDIDKMSKYMSNKAYKAVLAAVREGAKLDLSAADEIAEGMKTWAMEKGATHYTHLFQPLTDATAEKHEAFIHEKNGRAFEKSGGNEAPPAVASVFSGTTLYGIYRAIIEMKEPDEKSALRAIRNVPEAYEVFEEQQTVDLFGKLGILNENEPKARFEVFNETYVKKLQIEARVAGDICTNHVIPAAIKYQNTIIDNVRGMKELFGADYAQYCSEALEALKSISTYVNEISQDVRELVDRRAEANRIEDIHRRALEYSHSVKDMMDKVRTSADHLEMLVDDELWPLPKYRELLFF